MTRSGRSAYHLSSMRVVVVGASGNVGTALLRRLQMNTGTAVVGVSRRRPVSAPPFDITAAWPEIDVADPDAAARLRETFDSADAVVNLVWGFQPTRRPDRLHAVGPAGAETVLTAAVDAGVAHVVQASSVGVYAPRTDLRPVTEDYPATGVPGSLYSQHKVELEQMLDRYEKARPDGPVITRLRPGFVLQRAAGAALARYGLPAYLPGPVLGLLPLLPLDAAFTFPVIHADDLADAVVRILERRLPGAVNLAAEMPLTRDDIAAVLGSKSIAVPGDALTRLVGLTWRSHLQSLDGGWITLARSVPMLDTARARTELDWHAVESPVSALRETVSAMRNGQGGPGPVLRPRSVLAEIRHAARDGSVSRRLLA